MAENKVITWDELKKHTTRADCWVCIEEKVFNVSSYFAEHPGGDEILMKYGGKDATQKFQSVGHSDYAKSIRDQLIVGKIESNPPSESYKKWEANFWEKNKDIHWDEVSTHNSISTAWVVYKNKVYDIVKVLEKNPSQLKLVFKRLGKDVTQLMDEDNNTQLKETFIKEEFQIGTIKQGSLPPIEKKELSGQMKVILVILGILFGFLYDKFFKEKQV